MTYISIIKIEKLILEVRGRKVLLDSDLANLYQVDVKHLNRQVKRNSKRFPPDFAFQLTLEELSEVNSIRGEKDSHGGRRKLPYVFTELGIAMLSSVLNSNKAIEVNIQIMRIFVGLRDFALQQKTLEARLNELEEKSDFKFKIIFDSLREIIVPSLSENRRKMGLKPSKD